MASQEVLQLFYSVLFLCQFFKLSPVLTQEIEKDELKPHNASEVKSENIDFVLLRMKHLFLQTPSDMTNLRPLLEAELNASAIYRAAWDGAIQIFNNKSSKLVNLADGENRTPDEYHIALIAYTLHDTPPDNPFFSDFNKLTRQLCSGIQIEENFPYKTFFKLLSLAVTSVSKNKLLQSNSGAYYRGVGIEFELKINQQIAFQHFLSVTSNLKKAEEFSANTTVFEFHGPIPNSISMIHHSKFPEEEELLVSPLVVYEVESIHRGSHAHSHYTKYVLAVSTNPITLFASDPSAQKKSSGVRINLRCVSLYLVLILAITILI